MVLRNFLRLLRKLSQKIAPLHVSHDPSVIHKDRQCAMNVYETPKSDPSNKNEVVSTVKRKKCLNLVFVGVVLYVISFTIFGSGLAALNMAEATDFIVFASALVYTIASISYFALYSKYWWFLFPVIFILLPVSMAFTLGAILYLHQKSKKVADA